ncbi:hypothetical protein JYU34_017344 [Plutella xylostella]|uniref:Uncharacterized protein n=1 Tax=Plutella xylostella TaxID=51655 RepID=A0ABQ7Q0X8_PLUXY|nr:hypothetical protein JYU34_017344 [Plutella xylostella]
MVLKKVFIIFVLCFVAVELKEHNSDECAKDGIDKRVKRSKYFSSPPPGAIRYFKRPPPTEFNKGTFSYTPPPNYMSEDEDLPYPTGSFPSRPPQVMKKPLLNDEDINNFVRYLSKQDLDKIVELANERDRNNRFKNANGNEDRFNLNGPYVSNNVSPYSGPPNNNGFANQGHMQQKVTYDNGPNQLGNNNQGGYSTNDEELLPKPVNLRDDGDNVLGAYTQNVPSIARPLSSYKVEGFGDLPVMDYHSKMFMTSSYNVPHYSSTPPPPSPPAYEPAPPASEGKAQSDAHLKAVRIWTHRSNGQAYTLHDDGSLSVERPKYG